MRVVVDVIDAVAVVAVAFRTVAELQIGILGVGTAADCALMPVGLFAGFGMISVCPVGIGFWVRLALLWAAVAHRRGQKIFYVGAKEQEKIEQRHQREQPEKAEESI